MSDHANKRPDFNEGQPPMPGSGMRRGLPIGVAAAILVIAAIIFNAAGPDRTRTAQNDNPNAQPTTTEQASPESGIPASSDRSPAIQPAPARSNPAGTQ